MCDLKRNSYFGVNFIFEVSFFVLYEAELVEWSKLKKSPSKAEISSRSESFIQCEVNFYPRPNIQFKDNISADKSAIFYKVSYLRIYLESWKGNNGSCSSPYSKK